MLLTLRQKRNFWSKVTKGPKDVCWLWTGARKTYGHGQVKLWKKAREAHRIVYMMVHGSIPDGMVVRHQCDTPNCVNPRHLALGTHADNVRDRVERGRSATRENHGRAKLNSEKVAEIRKRIAAGEANCRIAQDYGVDGKTIWFIQKGLTWREEG